jgi:hypothetical protein
VQAPQADRDPVPDGRAMTSVHGQQIALGVDHDESLGARVAVNDGSRDAPDAR